MGAHWRTIATIGFVLVLLAPAAGTGDGVPLSSYSMYARPRASEVTFVVPVGQSLNGSQVDLSPGTIAGSPDPLIVESYLRREVEGGRVEVLCEAIASRVVDDDVHTIQIRSERHNVVDRVLGEQEPVSSVLLASCLVP